MTPREAVDKVHLHVQDMCTVPGGEDDELADLVEAVAVLDKLVVDAEEHSPQKQAETLSQQYGGHWGEHPDYPRCDWGYEANNNDTRLGYWDWVLAQIDSEEPCPCDSGHPERCPDVGLEEA